MRLRFLCLIATALSCLNNGSAQSAPPSSTANQTATTANKANDGTDQWTVKRLVISMKPDEGGLVTIEVQKPTFELTVQPDWTEIRDSIVVIDKHGDPVSYVISAPSTQSPNRIKIELQDKPQTQPYLVTFKRRELAAAVSHRALIETTTAPDAPDVVATNSEVKIQPWCTITSNTDTIMNCSGECELEVRPTLNATTSTFGPAEFPSNTIIPSKGTFSFKLSELNAVLALKEDQIYQPTRHQSHNRADKEKASLYVKLKDKKDKLPDDTEIAIYYSANNHAWKWVRNVSVDSGGLTFQSNIKVTVRVEGNACLIESADGLVTYQIKRAVDWGGQPPGLITKAPKDWQGPLSCNNCDWCDQSTAQSEFGIQVNQLASAAFITAHKKAISWLFKDHDTFSKPLTDNLSKIEATDKQILSLKKKIVTYSFQKPSLDPQKRDRAISALRDKILARQNKRAGLINKFNALAQRSARFSATCNCPSLSSQIPGIVIDCPVEAPVPTEDGPVEAPVPMT